MLLLSTTFAQRTITGTVIGSEDNLSLPGVNVFVQGTTTGTITDLEGQYSIEVPDGNVTLQFSFVGYNTELITVGSNTVIDVVMSASLMALDEVVITSLGIAREKKRITYSAQNVDADEVIKAREPNPVNALQGKVAGVEVTKASGGVGGASRVIIRGNSSIARSNQPLYIVDGVPINNSSWGVPSSDNGGVQAGDGIGNINPDDIKSMTVLKGPNAVALYGSRAANGAVVIQTKQGVARQGIGVEFNTNTSMEKAMILTKFQNEYGQGNGGTYIKTSEHGWGARMEGQMVETWSKDPADAGQTYAYSPHNNFEEFFQTGFNTANTISLTAGSEKIRGLFSYTNTQAQGIVKNNGLSRNNFNLRVDGNLTKKLSFDAKLTYFNQHVDNRLATGDDYNNPLRALYRQPSNISNEYAESHYEYFTSSGERWQNYWNWPTNGGENIFWMINRTIRDEDRNRILGMGSVRYEFIDGLSLMVRAAFDQVYEYQTYSQYNWTYTIADAGNYSVDDRHAMEVNLDALLNYNKVFGDFSVNVSAGGNMLNQQWDNRNQRTNRLLKPNFFNINNTSQIRATNNLSQKRINSVYGFATVGFKDFLFLDVTGRNDWSSTLPKENWSYFYPSVGLTWIITEMFDSSPSWLSFAKIRGSYAEVGNDTSPYAIHNTYSFGAGGQLGYAWRGSNLAAQDLKPENTKSWELGFDVRFFQNRLGVDFTWYKANTFNQLLSVPLPRASGFNNKFINAGNIQNKGIEVIVNLTPVMSGEFRWDIMANFAQNENLCVELTPELEEYTTRGRSWMTTQKVVVGEEYGQIFTKGFIRENFNEETGEYSGKILVYDTGIPQVTVGQTVRGGSAAPDWLGGLGNSFSWKGISLSALIDARMGGRVYSYTEANLTSDGFSEQTLNGREGFVVPNSLKDAQDYDANPDGDPIWVENDIQTTAEAYWLALGGRNSPTGEPYGYDASFVRLREVILGYTFKLNNPVLQSIDLSLYGRNLAFLHNPSEIIDPGMSMGIGNIQGVEGFGMPTTRTFGINARFKF